MDAATTGTDLSWAIGDVTVTRVVEIVQPVPVAGLLPDASPEALAPHAGWLAPHFLDDEGMTALSIHALVVQSEGVRIVVDLDAGPRVSVLEQSVRGRVHDDAHGDRVVVSWHDDDVIAVGGAPIGSQNATPTAAVGAAMPGISG